jgi:hypothetical protein
MLPRHSYTPSTQGMKMRSLKWTLRIGTTGKLSTDAASKQDACSWLTQELQQPHHDQDSKACVGHICMHSQ